MMEPWASDLHGTARRRRATATGNGHDTLPPAWRLSGPVPTLSWWLERELQPADYLVGELLSTTSRILFSGPSGIGKTNFLLALTLSLATGSDFLHWHTVRAGRVLYIDGEMPVRLIKRRLADAVQRQGSRSDNLIVVSREDYPDMPPLNTPAGQQFVDQFIGWAGPFDLVLFDNIQSLLFGGMKESEEWSKMLGWIRDLSRQKVGQIWVHHTNRDGNSYGDSTREWQMDTVMLLEGIDGNTADIAFNLKFIKARERTPDNRSDFDDAELTLADEHWASSRIAGSRPPRRPAKLEDIALRALDEALATSGKTVAHPKIAPYTMCVTVDQWKAYFCQAYVGEADPKSVDKMFYRFAAKLQAAQTIRSEKPWVWKVESN
jgi:AAA domain